MNEVPPQNYTTVLRGMILHENDLTNHRLMWLLIGQGFIANAYASRNYGGASSGILLPLVGILLTLSAFGMLYNSYQARRYLQVLAHKAQQGTLKEEQLPFVGWPRSRITGWWKGRWFSPWLGRKRDVLEPWMLLPYMFMVMWLTELSGHFNLMGRGAFLFIALIISAVIFSGFCILWVWAEDRDAE